MGFFSRGPISTQRDLNLQLLGERPSSKGSTTHQTFVLKFKDADMKALVGRGPIFTDGALKPSAGFDLKRKDSISTGSLCDETRRFVETRPSELKTIEKHQWEVSGLFQQFIFVLAVKPIIWCHLGPKFSARAFYHDGQTRKTSVNSFSKPHRSLSVPV